MQKIVGVKRYKDTEIYYFLQNIDNLKLGDSVVVNFEDFQTVAKVVKLGLEVSDDKTVDMGKILRVATPYDISKYESLLKKAKDYIPTIKKKSLELGLVMKFVSAEYSLDNSKIIIVFASEERVDFRQFLKELALILKIRIELKQIGQRDEVKICDSVGICGQQCCCARFLDDFEHVTVKMAKTQGLSLSPTKINGACGRLMCCLGYESEMYEKMLEKMPKVGSTIKTPSGEGVVVYNDILREKVTVKRQNDNDTSVMEEFTLEELATGKRIVKEEEKEDSMAKLDEFFAKNNVNLAAETSKVQNLPDVNTEKQKSNTSNANTKNDNQAKQKVQANDGKNKQSFNKPQEKQQSQQNSQQSKYNNKQRETSTENSNSKQKTLADSTNKEQKNISSSENKNAKFSNSNSKNTQKPAKTEQNTKNTVQNNKNESANDKNKDDVKMKKNNYKNGVYHFHID